MKRKVDHGKIPGPKRDAGVIVKKYPVLSKQLYSMPALPQYMLRRSAPSLLQFSSSVTEVCGPQNVSIAYHPRVMESAIESVVKTEGSMQRSINS